MSEDCETVEERLARLETLLEARQHFSERTEENLKERLAGMNELREAMKDQAGRYVTRSELYWAFSSVLALVTAIVLLLRR